MDICDGIAETFDLSVSSNGSTWVKPGRVGFWGRTHQPFSILERIDVGETMWEQQKVSAKESFSILERIDVGETQDLTFLLYMIFAFSILERIDVGETNGMDGTKHPVSFYFQYPRTDRRG